MESWKIIWIGIVRHGNFNDNVIFSAIVALKNIKSNKFILI